MFPIVCKLGLLQRLVQLDHVWVSVLDPHSRFNKRRVFDLNIPIYHSQHPSFSVA